MGKQEGVFQDDGVEETKGEPPLDPSAPPEDYWLTYVSKWRESISLISLARQFYSGSLDDAELEEAQYSRIMCSSEFFISHSFLWYSARKGLPLGLKPLMSEIQFAVVHPYSEGQKRDITAKTGSRMEDGSTDHDSMRRSVFVRTDLDQPPEGCWAHICWNEETGIAFLEDTLDSKLMALFVANHLRAQGAKVVPVYSFTEGVLKLLSQADCDVIMREAGEAWSLSQEALNPTDLDAIDHGLWDKLFLNKLLMANFKPETLEDQEADWVLKRYSTSVEAFLKLLASVPAETETAFVLWLVNRFPDAEIKRGPSWMVSEDAFLELLDKGVSQFQHFSEGWTVESFPVEDPRFQNFILKNDHVSSIDDDALLVIARDFLWLAADQKGLIASQISISCAAKAISHIKYPQGRNPPYWLDPYAWENSDLKDSPKSQRVKTQFQLELLRLKPEWFYLVRPCYIGTPEAFLKFFNARVMDYTETQFSPTFVLPLSQLPPFNPFPPFKISGSQLTIFFQYLLKDIPGHEALREKFYQAYASFTSYPFGKDCFKQYFTRSEAFCEIMNLIATCAKYPALFKWDFLEGAFFELMRNNPEFKDRLRSWILETTFEIPKDAARLLFRAFRYERSICMNIVNRSLKDLGQTVMYDTFKECDKFVIATIKLYQ